MKAVIVLLTVIFVGLTGCATKRNLTQQEQLDAASKWIDIRRCTSSNRMSPELGAVGDWHVNGLLSEGKFNTQDLTEIGNKYERDVKRPSDARCADLSILFAGIKRNLDANNAAEAARAGQAPKTTTCNRFGTMTTCNSY